MENQILEVLAPDAEKGRYSKPQQWEIIYKIIMLVIKLKIMDKSLSVKNKKINQH